MRMLLWMALATCLSGGSSLAAQSKGGAGDLMVMPTRVVLEGRERAAEVALRNAGSQKASYRISFLEYDMDVSGNLVSKIKKEGELTASDLVRFSPRQVDLEPGETQLVRIQLRKPEALPAGEYRSHLLFQAVPPPEAARPVDAAEEKAISLDVKMVFGISIPVIIRHGEVSATVSLANLRLAPPVKPDGAPVLALDLCKRGNRSVNGEFQVQWEPTSGRNQTLVPVAGGVIYQNLDARHVSLELAGVKAPSLKGGRIRATFTPKDLRQAPVTATLDIP